MLVVLAKDIVYLAIDFQSLPPKSEKFAFYSHIHLLIRASYWTVYYHAMKVKLFLVYNAHIVYLMTTAIY